MSHFAPAFGLLQPYPFQKFAKILATITPNAAYSQIRLSIGEPQHPTPTLIKDALAGALDGLARYPATHGMPELRESIAGWVGRRYGVPTPDADRQVLPVNGTREALFALAQTVVDANKPEAGWGSPEWLHPL